jgi:sugar (pentulose or hexulose) kinase
VGHRHSSNQSLLGLKTERSFVVGGGLTRSLIFYERGRPRICVLPSVHSTVTLTLIGRFHIYWAILEGIALTICRCGTAMGKETGESHGRLVVSGGGSNSDVFTHIFADVFGIPAARAKMNTAAGWARRSAPP